MISAVEAFNIDLPLYRVIIFWTQNKDVQRTLKPISFIDFLFNFFSQTDSF